MTKKLTPRQLWVKALRSGKYSQGRDSLQTEGGYCCLGVACVVAEKEGISVRRYGPLVGCGEGIKGNSLASQEAVKVWLGMRTGVGAMHTLGYRSLSDLNDTGTTFKDIADLIESEPEGLFIN
jgi:hypothetical protein